MFDVQSEDSACAVQTDRDVATATAVQKPCRDLAAGVAVKWLTLRMKVSPTSKGPGCPISMMVV